MAGRDTYIIYIVRINFSYIRKGGKQHFWMRSNIPSNGTDGQIN